MGKGEIARFEQFLLFPQCFQKTCTAATINQGFFGRRLSVSNPLVPPPFLRRMAQMFRFVTGFGDCVRCFFCAIGLRNWEKGDDPWAEHARWSQKCSYVLEKKGFAFVKSHQNETDEPYNAEASASAPPLKYDKEENCRRQEIGNQVCDVYSIFIHLIIVLRRSFSSEIRPVLFNASPSPSLGRL